MRWKPRVVAPKPRPADWSLRYAWKMAYLPEFDKLNDEWVWLEEYVAQQYWSPTFRRWRSTDGMGSLTHSPVHSDCRRKG